MKIKQQRAVPVYNDGYLYPMKLVQDSSTDFPKEVLEPLEYKVWMREVSVYDRLQFEFNQGGKEITAKVRIPRNYDINSKCCVKVYSRRSNGEIYDVQNAADVVDKETGVEETELTLVAPEQHWEVANGNN